MFVRLRNLIMSPLPTVKPFNICLILSFHVRCWKDARIVVWIFRIITLARNKMLRTESCISTRTPQRAIGLPPIDSSNPSLSPNKVFWKTIKFHSPWTITVSAAMTINCWAVLPSPFSAFWTNPYLLSVVNVPRHRACITLAVIAPCMGIVKGHGNHTFFVGNLAYHNFGTGLDFFWLFHSQLKKSCRILL